MSVVVIGGGPAGASAACMLAAGGRDVIVLEREPGPAHKVCGDFLSIEAQRSLAALGVDAAALGATRIDTVRLVHGRRIAQAPLGFTAAGLTRRSLDAALLHRAAALGARVRMGTSVRALDAAGVRTDAGVTVSDTVLLATGKHALRGAPRGRRPDDLIGLKMYWALAPAQAKALNGAVEVIPFDTGYAGLNAVENGMANLCLLVGRERFARAGGWTGLLAALWDECPHLATRMAGARMLLDRPLAVTGLAYGYVHRQLAGDALFRLGDQAAMIASLTGDGIAIALHSGRLAAATLLGGGGAAAYHVRLRGDIGAQVGRAQLIHRAFRQPMVRALLTRGGQAWPGLLPLGAALTRIPGRAERRLALAQG